MILTHTEASVISSFFFVCYIMILIRRLYKIQEITQKKPWQMSFSVATVFYSGLYLIFQGWRFDPTGKLLYFSSFAGNYIVLQELNIYHLKNLNKKIGPKWIHKLKNIKYFLILIALFAIFNPTKESFYDSPFFEKIFFIEELAHFLFCYFFTFSVLNQTTKIKIHQWITGKRKYSK